MQRRRNKVELERPEERAGSRIRPAYLVLLACMALFAFKFLEKTQEVRQLAAQEAAIRYQNAATARDNQRLQRAIGYYRTPAFIESSARTYGFTRPGDVPIQIQPVSQRVVAVRAAPLPPTYAEPVWKQWWSAFFP